MFHSLVIDRLTQSNSSTWAVGSACWIHMFWVLPPQTSFSLRCKRDHSPAARTSQLQSAQQVILGKGGGKKSVSLWGPRLQRCCLPLFSEVFRSRREWWRAITENFPFSHTPALLPPTAYPARPHRAGEHTPLLPSQTERG